MIYEFRATGTIWKIDCETTDLANEVKARISEFEQTYSRFLDNSFTAKISNTVDKFDLPDDSKPMFDLYFELFNITEGLFTPLIGQTLNETGYDKNYSLVPKKINQVLDLRQSVEYNYPTLNVKFPMQFDFGGVGKGYLVDIVSALLKERGSEYFVINAGGDIYHHGKKDVVIGLEHPNSKDKVIGQIKINGKSICSSSGNRRRWQGYHHIINPKELKSPENVLATWVVSDRAIIADSIATCLFLVSPEKLNRYYDYEYLILYSDYSIKKSEGFDATIYA